MVSSKQDLPSGDNTGTARHLEARHIQMIAIGGTIGTGLFLNSSNVISSAGALGALIAYLFAGVAVFFVVSSLGEMATLIPVSGSFAEYASRFIDPALGFAVGWNYCLLITINFAIEIIACATFLSYWVSISKYILMIIVLVSLIIVNCFAVKGFGEIEYWLALIKIIAIIFFLVVAVYVLCRFQPGFSAYVEAGGPFLGVGNGEAFTNTIEALIGACFAFGGTEMVGITAGEAKNPRKSVPRAINGTFWRIMLFYVSSIFFIGLLLPANTEAFQDKNELAGSPFVLALEKAGIPGVDHFMNFICFIAVLSAANSAIYASSRSLMALAREGRAPLLLAKTTESGVPFYGIAVTVGISCVAFLGSLVGEGMIFKWLVKLVGLSIIVIWLLINVTHLRFRKAYLLQGYKIEDLPYKALFFPYGCYFGIFVCLGIIIGNPLFSAMKNKSGNFASDLVSNSVTVPLFLVFYLFWKFAKGTRVVPLKEVDLVTGNINLEPDSKDEVESLPKSFLAKVMNFIA